MNSKKTPIFTKDLDLYTNHRRLNSVRANCAVRCAIAALDNLRSQNVKTIKELVSGPPSRVLEATIIKDLGFQMLVQSVIRSGYPIWGEKPLEPTHRAWQVNEAVEKSIGYDIASKNRQRAWNLHVSPIIKRLSDPANQKTPLSCLDIFSGTVKVKPKMLQSLKLGFEQNQFQTVEQVLAAGQIRLYCMKKIGRKTVEVLTESLHRAGFRWPVESLHNERD